jgi:acetyl esterase/lipase
MHTNASSFSASPNKSVIMGGSAGGNLSTAVTLSLINEPDLIPQGLIVACATTIDPNSIPEEYLSFWQPERFLDAAMLNREAMTPCLGTYIPLSYLCTLSILLTLYRRLRRTTNKPTLLPPTESISLQATQNMACSLHQRSDS